METCVFVSEDVVTSGGALLDCDCCPLPLRDRDLRAPAVFVCLTVKKGARSLADILAPPAHCSGAAIFSQPK